ncbi:Phage antirepressor protein KilAC domain protein [compost metagenome]
MAKPVANLNDPASLRGLLLGYTEQVLKLEHKITEDAPKVEFYEEFVESKELQSVGDVAKVLGTGPIRLFRYLQKHKILIGGTGDNKNMPYQIYLNSGKMGVKYNNYTVPETGEVKIRPRPLFTRKGVDWIREFVKEHGRDGL